MLGRDGVVYVHRHAGIGLYAPASVHTTASSSAGDQSVGEISMSGVDARPQCPYEDVVVADLSNRLSGAFAARTFGDHGATVVLAERAAGHPLRRQPPFLADEPGPERSVWHAYVNWNKQSYLWRSRAELHDVVATADIVVTTAAPGSDPDIEQALAGLRPDAVQLSITPYGLESRLADRPGNHLSHCARTGWASINAFRDEAPLQLPTDQAGYVAGMAGFMAAAAALRRRGFEGGPEVVDVSELESFALTVHPWGVASVYEGRHQTRGPSGGGFGGQHSPLWAMSDGLMAFAIGDFRNWLAAMDAFGLTEMGSREELVEDLGRHGRDIQDVVEAIAATGPELQRWPLFHTLEQLRCPAGIVQTMAELAENEQVRSRGFIVTTSIGEQPVRAAGAPVRSEPPSWRLDRAAPRLGQFRHLPTPPDPMPRSSPTIAMSTAGPLSGVRVLSLGQAWAGTFGAELLAFLGADVVQVGSLDRPDVWRRVFPKMPAAVASDSRVQHPREHPGPLQLGQPRQAGAHA